MPWSEAMTHYRYNGHNRVYVCSNACEYNGEKLNLKLALPELEVIQDGGILDKAV